MDTVNQFKISSYLRHKHNGTTWEQEVKRYNETFNTSLTAEGYRASCRVAYRRFGSEVEEPKEMGDLFENFDTENFDLKSVRFSKGKNEETFTPKSFMLHPKKTKELTPEELMTAAREAFKEAKLGNLYVPTCETRENDTNRAIIFPAIEAHLGKVASLNTIGQTYDLKEGILRCEEIFQEVCEYQRINKASRCIIAIGGDLFNREVNGTTTHGTPIPSCSENYKTIFRSALSLYISGINTLCEVFPVVQVVNSWGNHASAQEFFLWEALRCTFSDNGGRVIFDDNIREATCVEFGANTLFFYHGDCNNRKRMISSLACEYPKEWGLAKHRYLFEGHLHSQHTANEEWGIVSYRVSAPCTADEWHYNNRYLGAEAGFEFFEIDEFKGIINQRMMRW